MKRTKQLLLIASILIWASCNQTDFSNPEDVIKNYKVLSIENKNDVLYNDYLSTKSKEFVTKDEYIKKRHKSDSLLSSTKITETKISTYPVDINNPSIRRFKVEEESIIKSDTTNSIGYYTLLNEDGKWRIIWTGTLHSFAFEKYKTGNYSEARKTLEKMIEINPFDGSAYSLLAWCYYRDYSLTKNERENGVVKNAKYAVTLEEENPEHYNTLAAYYSSIGNDDLAIQNFERGLNYCKNVKDKSIFYSNLAGIYIENKKFEKAEEYIKLSINLDDKDAFIWLKYGQLMLNQDKISEAIEFLEKALTQEKMDSYLQGVLYYCYSECCLKKNMCEVAKEYINKALDIEPDNYEYQALYRQIKYCNAKTQ